MATVTSNELKHMKSLLTKKGRKEHGQFVAEGVRVLEEAYRHRGRPVAVYCAPSLLSSRGEGIVTVFSKRGVPVKELSAQRLQGMTDTTTSQGILAVFEIPQGSLSELYRPSIRRVLLCEDVGDPGNVGTLIRSAAAFDFGLVCLVGACAEPYSPKVVRASAGSVFAVSISTAEAVDVLAFARERSLKLIAADQTGESDPPALSSLVTSPAIVLAVGSEAEGLSEGMLDAADLVVRLEHETAVESLNAGVAGSILMKQVYDITRDKRS
jgi:RNA methyltransferase, TrmH family